MYLCEPQTEVHTEPWLVYHYTPNMYVKISLH